MMRENSKHETQCGCQIEILCHKQRPQAATSGTSCLTQSLTIGELNAALGSSTETWFQDMSVSHVNRQDEALSAGLWSPCPAGGIVNISASVSRSAHGMQHESPEHVEAAFTQSSGPHFTPVRKGWWVSVDGAADMTAADTSEQDADCRNQPLSLTLDCSSVSWSSSMATPHNACFKDLPLEPERHKGPARALFSPGSCAEESEMEESNMNATVEQEEQSIPEVGVEEPSASNQTLISPSAFSSVQRDQMSCVLNPDQAKNAESYFGSSERDAKKQLTLKQRSFDLCKNRNPSNGTVCKTEQHSIVINDGGYKQIQRCTSTPKTERSECHKSVPTGDSVEKSQTLRILTSPSCTPVKSLEPSLPHLLSSSPDIFQEEETGELTDMLAGHGTATNSAESEKENGLPPHGLKEQNQTAFSGNSQNLPSRLEENRIQNNKEVVMPADRHKVRLSESSYAGPQSSQSRSCRKRGHPRNLFVREECQGKTTVDEVLADFFSSPESEARQRRSPPSKYKKRRLSEQQDSEQSANDSRLKEESNMDTKPGCETNDGVLQECACKESKFATGDCADCARCTERCTGVQSDCSCGEGAKTRTASLTEASVTAAGETTSETSEKHMACVHSKAVACSDKLSESAEKSQHEHLSRDSNTPPSILRSAGKRLHASSSVKRVRFSLDSKSAIESSSCSDLREEKFLNKRKSNLKGKDLLLMKKTGPYRNAADVGRTFGVDETGTSTCVASCGVSPVLLTPSGLGKTQHALSVMFDDVSAKEAEDEFSQLTFSCLEEMCSAASSYENSTDQADTDLEKSVLVLTQCPLSKAEEEKDADQNREADILTTKLADEMMAGRNLTGKMGTDSQGKSSSSANICVPAEGEGAKLFSAASKPCSEKGTRSSMPDADTKEKTGNTASTGEDAPSRIVSDQPKARLSSKKTRKFMYPTSSQIENTCPEKIYNFSTFNSPSSVTAKSPLSKTVDTIVCKFGARTSSCLSVGEKNETGTEMMYGKMEKSADGKVFENSDGMPASDNLVAQGSDFADEMQPDWSVFEEETDWSKYDVCLMDNAEQKSKNVTNLETTQGLKLVPCADSETSEGLQSAMDKHFETHHLPAAVPFRSCLLQVGVDMTTCTVLKNDNMTDADTAHDMHDRLDNSPMPDTGFIHDEPTLEREKTERLEEINLSLSCAAKCFSGHESEVNGAKGEVSEEQTDCTEMAEGHLSAVHTTRCERKRKELTGESLTSGQVTETPANDRVLGATSEAPCHAKPADSIEKFSYCQSVASDGSVRLTAVEAETMWNVETASLSVYDPEGCLGYSSTSGKERALRDESLHTAESLFQGGRGDSNLCQHTDVENQKPGQRTVAEEIGIDRTSAANIDSISLTSAADFDGINLTSSANSYKINLTSSANSSSGSSVNVATATGLMTAKESSGAFLPGTLCGEMELTAVDRDIVCRSPEGGGETERVKEESKLMTLKVATRVLQETSLPVVCAHPHTCAPEQSAPELLSTEVDEAKNSQKNQVDDADVGEGLDLGSFTSVKKSISDQDMTSRCQGKLYTNSGSLALPCQSTNISFSAAGFSTAGGKFVTLSAKAKEKAVALWKSVEKEMYAQEAAVTHGGDGDLSLARQNVTEEEVLRCGKKQEETLKKGREMSTVISAASLSPCLEPASAVDSRATLPKGFRPFRPPRAIRKPGEEHEKQDEKLEKSKLVSSFVRLNGGEDGRCEQIQHSLKAGDCTGRAQTTDLSDPLPSSPSLPENRNTVHSSRRTSDEFSDEGEGWGSLDLGVLLASHEMQDGVKRDVLKRDKVMKNSETLAKENCAVPRPSSAGNVIRVCCEHPGDKDDRRANVVADDVEMLELSTDVSSVIDACYLKQVADQHRFIASESATKQCLPQEVTNNINGSGFSEILSTKHPGSEDHMDLTTANLCDQKCSAEGFVTHLTSFTNSSDRKEGCGKGALSSQFKIDHSHKIAFSTCSRGPRGEIKTEPSYCGEGKNCKEDRYDEFSDEGLLYVFADESFDSVRREDCSLAVEGEPHEKDENESESRRNAREGDPLETSTVEDTQGVETDVMVDLDSAVAKELMDDILSRRETFSHHSVTEGNESVRDGNDSVTDGFLTNMEVGLDVSRVQQDTVNISMAEDRSLASQMEVMGGVLFCAPTTEDTGVALPCLEEAFGKSRELCPSTGRRRSSVQINNTFGTEFEKHVSSPGSKLNCHYEKQKQTKDNSDSFPVDSLVDSWIELAKDSDSLPARDSKRPKECSDPEKSSHTSVSVGTVESKESLPQVSQNMCQALWVTSADLEPGEDPTGQNDAEGKSDFKNACTILQGKKPTRTSESVLVTEVTEQCEEVTWCDQNVFTAPFEVTNKCSISLLVDRNQRITATAGSGTDAVAHTQCWPDTSCPDKHHVREEASESELKRDLPAEDMLSVKRDTQDYCRKEKDVEVQTFFGFQTGRGKPVKVSMKSMDAAKAFLEDVGVFERETSSNKSSHTKVVTCSGNMSVGCEDLRSDGDKILTALKPQNGKANTVTGVEEKSFGAFGGFSTASGNQVTVSEKSLCHGRKLLASIEDTTAKAYGTGAVEALTDFGDKSACRDKELVSVQDATRRGDGVRATETADVIDSLGEKSSYLDTKLSASVQDATTKGYGIRAVEAIIDVPDDFGFHTSRTKICRVSTSATNIRRDLDADTSRVADMFTESFSYTADSFHSRLPHTSCQGFATAGGRVVSVSKESLLRARAMLSDVEHPADVIRSPIAEGMEVWKCVNAEKNPSHVGQERKSSASQMAEMSAFTASGDGRVDPKTSGDGRVDPKESGDGRVDPKVSCDGRMDPKESCDGRLDPKASCDGRVDPKISGDGRMDSKASCDGRMDPKASGDSRVDPKASGDSRVDPKVQMPMNEEVLALSETVCHSDLCSEKGLSQQGGCRELTAGCVDTDTPDNIITFHLMQPQKVVGFQTARGKLVAPSRGAVKLALTLWSSILTDSCEESENEQHTVDRSGFVPGTEDVSKQEMDVLEGESAAETGGKCVAGERASCPDGSTGTGFQTVRDKQVTVSPVQHLQVQQVLQPDDPPGHEVSKDVRGSLNPSSFTGFQTGAGSKVTASEKALVHARKFMQSLDEIECDVHDSQAERKETPAVLVPSRVEFGFQTAKGSGVGVSKKSLERAQQLLKMDEQIVVSNHKQKFDLHIMGSSDTSGEMSDIPKHDQEVQSFLKEDLTDEITRCGDHGSRTKEQVVEVVTYHDSLLESENTENKTPQTLTSSMAVGKDPQILQHGGVAKRASTSIGSCQPLETGKSYKTLLCDMGKGTVDALPLIKRTACLKQKSPAFQPPLKKGKFVPPSCLTREKQAADYSLENHAHTKGTFVKNVSTGSPALHNGDITSRNIQPEQQSPDNSPAQSAVPDNSPAQSAVSDCLAREEATMQQAKIIRQKKRLKVRPAKGKWLTLKQTQKQMKLRDLDICPRLLTNHELVKAGVSPTVLGVNSCTAEEYRFFLPAFYPGGCSGVLMGDGALLVGDAFGFAGKEEFYRGFLTMDDVDPALTSQPWVYNHYRWLVWKLAAYEVALPQAFASRALTPDMLMTQLKYRYDREVDACQRSALKKIVERDDTASRRLVLCVSNIKREEASDTVTVEVTDGWYCIWAKPDLHLQQLIDRQKIQIGQKIITTGAELAGSHDACGPLEIPAGLHLKLWGNSTRPAPFWAKLGYQPCPVPLCVPLSSVVADGGLIGCVDIVVVRKYPVMFMEKRRDANCVFRTAEMEDRASHCYEQQKELIMERLCSKLQAEMEREDSVAKAKQKRQSLGLQEIQALTSGTELCEALDIESYPEEMQAVLTDRQREQLWEQRRRQQEQKQEQFRLRLEQAWHASLPEQQGERVVTPVQKLLVAGCCRKDVDTKTSLLLTVWRPGEDWEAVTEGKRYRMFSLTSSSRSRQSRPCVQLTAGRQTRLQSLAIDENFLDLVYEPREVWSVSDLHHRKPPYDEIDFTGRVHDIISTKQGYDSIRAMDLNGELISVLFWGGLQAFGLQNFFTKGMMFTGFNLRVRNSAQGQVEVVAFQETSYFIASSRLPELRSDRLRQLAPGGQHESGKSADWQTVSNTSLDDSRSSLDQSNKSLDQSTESPEVKQKRALQQQKLFRLQSYGKPPALSPLPNCMSPAAGKAFKKVKTNSKDFL